MTFFAVLAAKLVDPIVLIIAGLGGYFAARWSHVLAAGVIAAILTELALASINPGYRFDLSFVLVGAVAGIFWASAGFLIARAKRAKAERDNLTR